MDKYFSYDELRSECRHGTDYRICSKNRGTTFAIFAPHGGGIDLGSSEIAREIAREDFSFYLFEGIRKDRNNELHIPSDRFDEPNALELASTAEYILAIHSCQHRGEIVYVGGSHECLGRHLAECLNSEGFTATRTCPPRLKGQSRDNICNRGRQGKGVQLEICEGLRSKMFEKLTTRKGREATTETFERFVEIIRQALNLW